MYARITELQFFQLMPIWENTYDMGGLIFASQLEFGEKD